MLAPIAIPSLYSKLLPILAARIGIKCSHPLLKGIQIPMLEWQVYLVDT